MPLSTITAASASSHSTHRAAPQPFYGRQTAGSLCGEGAPRWSPTPTRASASSAADRERRAIGALGRQRAAAAHIALDGHARGTSSASPPRGTARTRRRCCAHRRRANPTVVPHRWRRPPGRVRRERHDPRLTPLRRERLSGPWTGPDGAPWMTTFLFRSVRMAALTARWRCAARLLDLICLGADAADFDCPLWMWVKQRLLSSPGSRRSNLHVERHRAPLRSTGRGSTSATRLEASLRTFGDMEDSRDPWFEPRCQRARLSFRPLCTPMAEPSALTHTTRLGTQSLTWLCGSFRTNRASLRTYP